MRSGSIDGIVSLDSGCPLTMGQTRLVGINCLDVKYLQVKPFEPRSSRDA